MSQLRSRLRRPRLGPLALSWATATLCAVPASAQTGQSDTEVLRTTLNQGSKTWHLVVTATHAANAQAPVTLTLNGAPITLDSTGAGTATVPNGGPTIAVSHSASGALSLTCPGGQEQSQPAMPAMPAMGQILGQINGSPRWRIAGGGGGNSVTVSFSCNGTTSMSQYSTSNAWNSFALRVWPESDLAQQAKQVGALLEGIQSKLESRSATPSDSAQSAADFAIHSKLADVQETLKQIVAELNTAP